MAAGIVLAVADKWCLVITILLFLSVYLVKKELTGPVITGIITMLLSLAYFNLVSIEPPDKLPEIKNSKLTGTVLSYPVLDNDKSSFFIKTESASIYCRKIRVVIYDQVKVSKGDKIELRGDLKPPFPPSNPGEFNYPAYLANNGVFYILSVKNADSLSILSNPQGPYKWINAYRSHTEKLFYEALTDTEAGIMLGMLLGKIDGIDEEYYDSFQQTGIVHIFSVGGLHVGFLLLLNGWLMSLLKRSTRFKMATGIGLLIFYGTIIGWPLPVVRSVIMGILGLLAYYSRRENSMLNALGLSGIIILLFNPRALFTISFQLTYMATFGLVYIYPLLRKHIRAQGWWMDLVLVPLCAEFAVLPLIAWHFNMFSPVSLLTNVLTTYLTGGAVILGFVAFLSAGIASGIAAIFIYPAGLLIDLILVIVDYMKIIPGAYTWVATPPIWLVMLYYLGLFTLLRGLISGCRRLRAGGAAVLLLVVASFYIPAGWYHRGQMEIVFIDVGQGDCILIKTPRGRFILVDGGGSQFYDVGKLKVLSYLHHRGIDKLYMAINSHPDHDHLLGLETVLKETPAQLIAVPASISDVPEYQRLNHLAEKQSITRVPLHQGQSLQIEKDFNLTVLQPGEAIYKDNSFNNQSLVLKISYRQFSVLLTGDIEEEAIKNLIAEDVLTTATVVKVPHHGSKTSVNAEFYERIEPFGAVICVGRDNTFGHPHPSILKLLDDRKIKCFRTDINGAVQFLSDGKSFRVKLFYD
ncbi:MAG: DNA internalization-related competence protein ComEC/Rec2 [Syntrophomonadaceae bacterium]|jgi:competence protein ComEC